MIAHRALRADPARLLAAARRAAREPQRTDIVPIDPERPFLPEAFTQLYHTTLYCELSPAQRLRYNQLYGLRCNEQFMMFEQGFTQRVIGGLRDPLRRRGDVVLADCLDLMLEEEARHHAMFARFNRHCRPDCYDDERGYFTRLSRGEALVLSLLTSRSNYWPMLVWLVLVLEEFSLGFSRMLARDSGDGDLGALDSGYAELHRLHLLDEARHVPLDTLAVEWLMARSARGFNRWNAWLFRHALVEILSPKRSGIRVIRRLVQDFPALRCCEREMVDAVRALGIDPGVDAIISDPAAMPQTRQMIERYPEFAWARWRQHTRRDRATTHRV